MCVCVVGWHYWNSMFDKDIITSHCSYKPPFCTIFLQRKTNNLYADSQDFSIVPKRGPPDRAVFLSYHFMALLKKWSGHSQLTKFKIWVNIMVYRCSSNPGKPVFMNDPIILFMLMSDKNLVHFTVSNPFFLALLDNLCYSSCSVLCLYFSFCNFGDWHIIVCIRTTSSHHHGLGTCVRQ